MRRDLVLAAAFLIIALGLYRDAITVSPVNTVVCSRGPPSGGGGGGSNGALMIVPMKTNCVFAEAYNVLVWNQQSYLEIAEGFAIAAVLLLVLSVRRLNFRWLHKAPISRFKWVFVVLALICMGVYALVVVVNVTSHLSTPVHILGHRIQTHIGPLGVIGVTTWGFAVISLSLILGISKAARFCGFPALLFLAVAILIGDPLQMTNHITNFTSWTFTFKGLAGVLPNTVGELMYTLPIKGFYIVNNWLLFVVSLIMTLRLLVKS